MTTNKYNCDAYDSGYCYCLARPLSVEEEDYCEDKCAAYDKTDNNNVKHNRHVSIIACVDVHWAIGLYNKLLYRIADDMQFFVKKTTNHTVIMGRKTLESLPNPDKGLPHRRNIVLSSTMANTANYNVLHSTHEVERFLNKQNSDDEIFVIGGETVYHKLLPLCDTAYITKVFDHVNGANKFMPNLDQMDDWTCVYESEIRTDDRSQKQYQFCTYKRMHT